MEELLYSTKQRDRHAELRKLNETCKQRLLELLTDEQEAKYHEMTGPPFRASFASTKPRSSRKSLRSDRLLRVPEDRRIAAFSDGKRSGVTSSAC